MKTFFRIENGFLQAGQCDDKSQVPEGWTETGNHDIYKYNNQKEEWFDIIGSSIEPIEEDERIRRGIQFDKRGTYYNKETREEKKVTMLDEDIDENIYTKEIPIENELYQLFDKGKWVIDTEKKERAEKEKELGQLKAQVNEAERKIIRPLRAKLKNRADEEDANRFDELDTFIESLRPRITELEAELKSA